jgi:hypothetical protein
MTYINDIKKNAAQRFRAFDASVWELAKTFSECNTYISHAKRVTIEHFIKDSANTIKKMRLSTRSTINSVALYENIDTDIDKLIYTSGTYINDLKSAKEKDRENKEEQAKALLKNARRWFSQASSVPATFPMVSVNKPASPSIGTLYYNTNTGETMVFDGRSWIKYR